MKLAESPLCSWCKTVNETSFHFFIACPATQLDKTDVPKVSSLETRKKESPVPGNNG